MCQYINKYNVCIDFKDIVLMLLKTLMNSFNK